MGSQVTFDNGAGTSIEINGPVSTDCALVPRFVTEASANHTRYAYTTTTSEMWQWTLLFRQLSLADKNKLEDFFRNTAKGPHNAFEYTHTSGTSYASCRFAETTLNFARLDDNTWDVNVTIESPNQIAA